MTNGQLSISLNLQGLWGKLCADLQSLFDTLSLLEAGASHVTQEQVNAAPTFMKLAPSENTRVPHEEVRANALDWLTRGFIRDASESAALFLDECLKVCALITLAAKRTASGAEVKAVLDDGPKKFHKLNFPTKLATLESEYGVTSALTPHIKSINRVRACLVHRMGIVGPQDVDGDAKLTLTLKKLALYVTEPNGPRTVLDRPTHLKDGGLVEAGLEDTTRVFDLGEKIHLSAMETYAAVVTYIFFSQAMATSVEAFARRLGIPITGLIAAETEIQAGDKIIDKN